jgi:phenylacetate-CoA ligase
MKLHYYNPVIERMSRDELLGLQFRKLKQQVEWAYSRSDFYKRKFQRAGVTPDDIQSLDDFRMRVPITTKKDLLEDQQEFPPYGSRCTVPLEKLVRFYLTSGTSGLGQEIHPLTRSDIEYGANWEYGFQWAGLAAGDVFASTLPAGLGNLAGPDTAIQSIIRRRFNLLNLSSMGAEQKISMMQRFGVKYIFAVPAYVQRLLDAAQKMMVDVKSWQLKGILLAAESYPLEWAEYMQQAWGTQLGEMYGSTALGTGGAFSCEFGVIHKGRRGMMHLLEHVIHADVINRETGEPVMDGESGEAILTSLEREGFPLLRFASDDKVVYLSHRNCPCGRPFDGWMAGEVARFDDMMKIKAVNVWPQAIDEIVLTQSEVAEYQGVVQEGEHGTEVIVQIEFHPECDWERREALLRTLPELLRQRIGVSMHVVEATEQLPRFEFKVRRWTDKRREGLQRVLYTEKVGGA